jgi:hypothetical protein
LKTLVVQLKPATKSRLEQLSATTAGAPDELVEDAMSGYLAEPSEVRKMRRSRAAPFGLSRRKSLPSTRQ